ncbi:disulfide bond formation protein B [Defluviimonas sp. D31]|uniref:disulfide bond formation protein B n=1 Tax=Defluviimonas sp. D31 TaxID=3083253 RepID=UPI00296F49A0|nr:disulfide bond formation protein B [Defluviimonas sp. D31]MDW4547887.1 disulfide bond formation protein B [Defluviimonas sp. D31]
MTRTRLILLAAGGSLALLAGAFVFQALGYAPCKLCIWQRWPHGIAIAIGGIALVKSLGWLPWVGALAALTTAGIGVFHAGVELRWWPGPDTCTSSGDLAGSAEDLLNQIMAAPLVRCDEVAWMFAGLSMAAWNAILSFALAALWIAAARRT